MKSGASTNNMCIIGRCNTMMADQEEARGSSIAKFRRLAEGVIQVPVGANTSMLRVSARSEIAVYLRGFRKERLLNVHRWRMVNVKV